MRNVLVTGGAGFIGSHFVRALLQAEEKPRVINLDLLTYAGSLKNLEKLNSDDWYRFVQGDICDAVLLKKIFREHRIDTVVHFAAETHVDRSIKGPAPFVQTNIVGTFNLLHAALEHSCRFHHVSTDEVFGALNEQAPAFTETSRYVPSSPYSASKAASDHLVRAYFHTYHLRATVSHCSNNYGPNQHHEKFIPTVIRSCMQNQPIPVYGDGSQVRDWLYVQDHCEGIIKILRHGKIGETYNLGGNCELSNLKVAYFICDLMNKKYPDQAPHEKLIQFVADRPGHDWRYAMDITKITRELDWKPRETFLSGMHKTIVFYSE